jgi:hypothetical protein
VKITPGSIVADKGETVVLVGPITGTVTTADGTTYDVSGPAVAIPDGHDHVEEVAHLVAQRYADEGHPTDPNFTYEAPKKFAKKGR